MSQPTSNLDQTIRGMQVITGALIAGVVMFVAIAVFVVGALSDPPAGVIISALGAAWAGIAFVLHLVIPAVMVRQGVSNADEEELYGVYRGKTIIGLALLEGAAFLNVIALIIEHNWWSLAIVGGLVFWMLGMLPTRTKIEHWVETQQMQHGHK